MKKQITYCLAFILGLMFSPALHAQDLPNENKFTTAHGYIKLGPFNYSFAHIYTNRPRFIFN